MKEYQFEGSFLYYLRLTKRLYENTLAAAAAEIALTVPEAEILCFLRENPGFDTARDIATYRDVSRSYVSKAVELLVSRGYLAVNTDNDDRRLQHLTITTKAKPVAEKIHEALFSFYDNVTANLTQKEITTLLTLLGKCAASITPERAE